jgi:hypothetical protein
MTTYYKEAFGIVSFRDRRLGVGAAISRLVRTGVALPY